MLKNSDQSERDFGPESEFCTLPEAPQKNGKCRSNAWGGGGGGVSEPGIDGTILTRWGIFWTKSDVFPGDVRIEITVCHCFYAVR